MAYDFHARAQNLALVQQALQRMKEHGFLVLSSERELKRVKKLWFLALSSERDPKRMEKLWFLWFLALSSEGDPIEGAGCIFTLESEARFRMDRPLQIKCFSTKPSATKWIAQTLLTMLKNLGIMESFATYYGPTLGCCAIYDEEQMIVEIN